MSHSSVQRPRIALTMGDVTGVGPEVTAVAAASPDLHAVCDMTVVGDSEVLRKALAITGHSTWEVVDTTADQIPQPSRRSHQIACWNPSHSDVRSLTIGRVHPAAGAAAYDWLVAATEATQQGLFDGIVTAPLHKEALHLAGHDYPGHTEILAERCGVTDYAMMLYLPAGDVVQGPHGLGVAHVTLHTSIASVPQRISLEAISEKAQLLNAFLKSVGAKQPRIAVCALNPHGGENGLFGTEEQSIIAPAVEAARQTGIDVAGPFPADTLMQQAVSGKYDGVVAMYHDQGHIALKLIAFQRAVNVTLGLPIVRTSPSHGTAFDIAWTNQVRTEGMISAVRTAVALIRSRVENPDPHQLEKVTNTEL